MCVIMSDPDPDPDAAPDPNPDPDTAPDDGLLLGADEDLAEDKRDEFQKGLDAAEAGDYQKALMYYEKAFSAASSEQKEEFQAGKEAVADGDFERGLEHYENAINPPKLEGKYTHICTCANTRNDAHLSLVSSRSQMYTNSCTRAQMRARTKQEAYQKRKRKPQTLASGSWTSSWDWPLSTPRRSRTAGWLEEVHLQRDCSWTTSACRMKSASA